MELKNDLILRAARGEAIERYPVWLMRQAGRILPEYRAVRAKLSGFKELVETPEFACEVTIQPVDLLVFWLHFILAIYIYETCFRFKIPT